MYPAHLQTGRRDGFGQIALEEIGMGIKIEFKHHAEKRQDATQSEAALRKDELCMDDLEVRLQNISGCLPNLNAHSELVPGNGAARAFDPALDLRVKVEAVQWMLRVVKHVQAPARERILLTVNNSLEQLEEAVNHKSHAA
jgi:hypothetical protein